MTSGAPTRSAVGGAVAARVEVRDLRRQRVDVAGDNSPRASAWIASASCGNSRILTAYSIGGPLPPSAAPRSLPVIATTSR